jgi:hypothetical protein
MSLHLIVAITAEGALLPNPHELAPKICPILINELLPNRSHTMQFPEEAPTAPWGATIYDVCPAKNIELL